MSSSASTAAPAAAPAAARNANAVGTSGSHLQISVEPAQASFFAGEEFACVITFRNTRTPVPQTQPLPARSTFESAPGDEEARRVVSTSAAGHHGEARLLPQIDTLKANRASTSKDGTSSGNLSPSLLNAMPSSRRFHRKSQSVDIRTFARRHQLDRNQLLDTEASDEHYYQTMSTLQEGEDELSSIEAQELLESLPGRRRLIGKNIAGQMHGIGSAHSTPTADSLPFTPTTRKHTKSYSVALPGERVSENVLPLGIGRPQGDDIASNGGHSFAFASPRIPSHRVPIDALTASPGSSRAPSGASVRKPSGAIAPTHPHSRKKSVAQVQAEDLSATFELDNVYGNDSTTDAESVYEAPSSVSSTPRVSIDARARHGTDEGFYTLGENSTMESVLREDITRFSRLGSNGHAMSPNKGMTPSGTPTRPTFGHIGTSGPGTETVLWTFAQFGGHFQVDESLIKPGEFEQVKQRLAGTTGPGMQRGMSGGMVEAIGGGELGTHLDGEDRSTSQGWGSYLRNVLASGSGSKRSALDGSHRRSGSTLLHNREKTMASRTIPVLSNPPSMVAVDLELGPGQSKSFTWRVPLPPDLPPSYIGRAISFHYTLTLGTNRLARNKRGLIEQKSRLVRIPMRVYNHVNISGTPAFYDLTNPIINRQDEAVVTDESEEAEQSATPSNKSVEFLRYQGLQNGGVNGKQQDKNGKVRKRRSSRIDAAAEKALLQYARELVQSCRNLESDVDEGGADVDMEAALAHKQQRLQELVKTSPTTMRANIALPPHPSSRDDFRSIGRHRRPSDSIQAGLGLLSVDDDDLPKNSHQAVELLSRNSQKVSYDISKDGQVAATLTLVKSKYRLGDTVMGVVSVNAAQSIAKVVRIAATLETHEEIEATLSTLPAGRAQKITRSVHASCHDSTLDAGQASFALPIPSGATPNFDSSAVKLAWTVRLAFLTQSCVREGQERKKPMPHLTRGPDDGYGMYHRSLRAVSSLAGPWQGEKEGESSEVKLEVVECAVPLTVLPHSTRFTAGEVAFMA